jgi:GT2 family glycosyltransferase
VGQPDLSVVIVTHNGREMALQTIRSARRTVERADVEWLVVDCGSTDGTAEAIDAEWSDITTLRRPNIGFAAGNNVALPRASGRYVLLLNPDIEVRWGTFDSLIEAMDRRPEVGAASVYQLAPDGSLLPSIRRFPSVGRKLGEAFFAERWPVARQWQEAETRPRVYSTERSADWLVGAFLIVRSEVLARVGWLDERFFLYSEEADWCFRIRASGWDVRHIPVMAITHFGAARTRPELMAQLSHSKVLFAKKHFGRLRAFGVRAALALGHLLRLVVVGPIAAVRSGARTRVRGEATALRVTLGLMAPPFRREP